MTLSHIKPVAALFTLLCAAPALSHGHQKHATSKQPLRVATWNIEHLSASDNTGCKPRTAKDIQALKQYAQSLNADIIALQEVASASAVRQVFSEKDWHVVMSDRADSKTYTCRKSGNNSTQQKIAFVVKKPLTVDKVVQHSAFSKVKPGLRNGLEIQLTYQGEALHLLNVHLKSGCFVDDYQRSDKEACKLLSKQAPILDGWVEQKTKVKTDFIVLGDFNHRLTAPYNRLSRDLYFPQGAANTQPNNIDNAPLFNANQMLTGCHPYYPAPIDHILVAKTLKDQFQSGSAQFHYFADMTPQNMLADHCALSIDLK
ncbi:MULTISPECIES: endonuclease/exonuclease/phosphatase family protein [Pseudoalteromonas]|uniref:endonuclease/exonuclease/phosphatase family protein n=1 Tax=Pseudoalteromonas TaxID=53246 RepID=UPI001891D487|nr:MULTISPECIES: endonuclease/exonuclease/phosphatase family protein [Pseudoalteromonas]MEC4087281.1 endonuclease/exonuclease/phosphatase family protein [Pseudoalteromonas rubra]